MIICSNLLLECVDLSAWLESCHEAGFPDGVEGFEMLEGPQGPARGFPGFDLHLNCIL
jgi:hypothetical protein